MKRQKIRKGIILVMFLLFPATFAYLSPYLIIQGAWEGVAVGSMLVFALMFLFSLVFGRAFCGWVCPAGAMQDCLTTAQDKKAKGGRRNWIKYFIWVPWLGFIATGAALAGGIRKLDFLYWTDHGFSVSDLHSLVIYLAVAGLIAAMSLLWGKRAMCHYICWMAPFMILGAKIRDALRVPSLRMMAEASKCTGCGQCSRKCPMSLNVSEMVKKEDMRTAECILCGECVDGCPRGAVSFRFGRSAKAAQTREKR